MREDCTDHPIGPFKHFSRILPPPGGGILSDFNGRVWLFFFVCFFSFRFFFIFQFYIHRIFGHIVSNRLLHREPGTLCFFFASYIETRVFSTEGGSMQINLEWRPLLRKEGFFSSSSTTGDMLAVEGENQQQTRWMTCFLHAFLNNKETEKKKRRKEKN